MKNATLEQKDTDYDASNDGQLKSRRVYGGMTTTTTTKKHGSESALCKRYAPLTLLPQREQNETQEEHQRPSPRSCLVGGHGVAKLIFPELYTG